MITDQTKSMIVHIHSVSLFWHKVPVDAHFTIDVPIWATPEQIVDEIASSIELIATPNSQTGTEGNVKS